MQDWRLHGQEKYLSGVELRWTKYTAYSPTWDHDHCEFCWRKFAVADGDLAEGYATLDRYTWVCAECFKDFLATFRWKVVE